jgi:membrane protein implicated in regulation of membrane protease activity
MLAILAAAILSTMFLRRLRHRRRARRAITAESETIDRPVEIEDIAEEASGSLLISEKGDS